MFCRSFIGRSYGDFDIIGAAVEARDGCFTHLILHVTFYSTGIDTDTFAHSCVNMINGFSGYAPWILRQCTLKKVTKLNSHMGQIPQDGNFGQNVVIFLIHNRSHGGTY